MGHMMSLEKGQSALYASYCTAQGGAAPQPIEGVSATHILINALQCHNLVNRCHLIYSTLILMANAGGLNRSPTQRLLSVFRSAHMLVRLMSSPLHHQSLLLERCSAPELFDGVKTRLKQVWSLQSTAKWESEDQAASTQDENHGVQTLMQADEMQHSTAEQLCSMYRRRRIGGWRVRESQIDYSASTWLSFGYRDMPPAAGDAAPASPLCSTEPECFLALIVGATMSGANVTHPLMCLRLHPTWMEAHPLTSRTLECSIIDLSARFSWCHPNVVMFHGGFTEHFAEDGTPSLTLGVVADEAGSVPFESLHNCLYRDGARFSLANIIEIILQVADALEYILFDVTDVPPEVNEAWYTLAPSNVFVTDLLFASNHEVPDSSATATGPSNAQAVPSAPTKRSEKQCVDLMRRCFANEYAFDPTTPRNSLHSRFHVRVFPGVYVEHGMVSRWAVPSDAALPCAFALSNLFVAMLTGVHPHRKARTQKQIGIATGHRTQEYYLPEGCTSATQRAASAKNGFALPRHVPVQLQTFLQRSFARRSNSSLPPSAVATSVPFSTLQEYRLELLALVPLAAVLPEVLDNTPRIPVERDLPDYGFLELDTSRPTSLVPSSEPSYAPLETLSNDSDVEMHPV